MRRRERARACALAALACVALALPASAWAAAPLAQRAALIARWEAQARPPAALRRALDATAPPSKAPDLAAMAARELAAPGRYHLTEAPQRPRTSWWARFWTWIAEQLRKLFSALFGRAHISRGGAAAIGDVLIALAAAVLLFAVWRLLAQLQFARERGRTSAEALAEPLDARAFFARAQAAASAGDLALASRLLFVAAVLALDLRGAVANDPSATVGDLRRALRARDAALLGAFDAVAGPFVCSAYAERPVAPSDWARARAAFFALLPAEPAA
ncbi:MAG TPA: hypothetical protein VMH02_05515 [Verrucomicrobiae bacterium]|nr:hypothetical protein [Verrucomicrobiae bacterium]